MRKARRAGVVRAIGTSGTINTLVAMARVVARRGAGPTCTARARRPARSPELRDDLVEANAALRVDLPGMDAKRVDLMPAAATLVGLRAGEFRSARSWSHAPGRCARACCSGSRARSTRVPPTDARRRSVNALALQDSPVPTSMANRWRSWR